MKIDDLKGCFANVNDDMLLRENGLLYAENEELKKENQRLNNVLNELEKELEIAYRELFENELVNGRDLMKNTLKVLKELKESDK